MKNEMENQASYLLWFEPYTVFVSSALEEYRPIIAVILN